MSLAELVINGARWSLPAFQRRLRRQEKANMTRLRQAVERRISACEPTVQLNSRRADKAILASPDPHESQRPQLPPGDPIRRLDRHVLCVG